MKLDLDDPIAVLLATVDAFRAAGLEGAAYGGLALAVYGEPRETKDADFAVATVRGEAARDALIAAGLDAEVTFDRVRFGGNYVTRITLYPGQDVTGLNTVDLVEPISPAFAAAAMTRALEGSLRGRTLRVLSPEDFILFKALSTRERDAEDAAAVVKALGTRLDRPLLEREGVSLVKAITDFDVASRLTRIFDVAS